MTRSTYMVDVQYTNGPRQLIPENTPKPALTWAEGIIKAAREGAHHPRDGAAHRAIVWEVTTVWRKIGDFGSGGTDNPPE